MVRVVVPCPALHDRPRYFYRRDRHVTLARRSGPTVVGGIARLPADSAVGAPGGLGGSPKEPRNAEAEGAPMWYNSWSCKSPGMGRIGNRGANGPGCNTEPVLITRNSRGMPHPGGIGKRPLPVNPGKISGPGIPSTPAWTYAVARAERAYTSVRTCSG